MIQLTVEDEGTVTPMGNRLKELPDENGVRCRPLPPLEPGCSFREIQTEMRGLKANAL
jgi:hypothetical protein